MTRDQCAALFGISLHAFADWEQRGRVTIPRFRKAEGCRRKVCYLTADVLRLQEELRRAEEPYPDPLRPGCYLVPIVTWKAPMRAIVDAADVHKVRGKSWNLSERHDEAEPRGTVVLAADNRILLKRVIAGLDAGSSDVRISHANGDFLDYRRSNLVVRTMAEQSYSCRKILFRQGRRCTSEYKGVSWVEERGKWTAHIHKGGKAYYLGLFEDEVEAARVYDNTARLVFGEHARLNFPDERPALRLPRAGPLSRPGAIAQIAA